MTCPSEPELARALTLGADPPIAAHLAACRACRETWDGTKRAIDLARELPAAIPPHGRREEVRTAVLAAAASMAGRPARRVWLAPAIAGAAAAGVIAYLAIPRGSSPPPVTAPAHHAHGTVHPHPGARYLATASGPDEVVRLTDGAIDVEVEPLSPGERFRVVVGGAEIEVRGTAFTVIASDEHLLGVTVARGRVDVRPVIGAPAVLGAGQSWHATLAAVVAPSSPPLSSPSSLPSSSPSVSVAPASPPHRAAVFVPAPPPVPAPRARHAAVLASPHPAEQVTPGEASPTSASPQAKPAGDTTRTPEELSYDQAWEALRANNFARAASGFSRVLLLAPDSPLVEDASFWHAVALARGKRSAEALSAFRDFLDTYARSARAGEANAMLGWILIDARAYDEAARRFRAAVGDASAAVRTSAQAGLDALGKRTP